MADTTPLQVAPFRRLWVANIVTVVGAQLTVMAVPAQIYADTGSSSYVGLTGIFGLVPLVVFGLWGGALADHFDRRLLLQITTIGLIVTSGLFWLQAALGMRDVWVLLIIFAVQQACFGINQPTKSAVLPRILPADKLPSALALSMTVTMAGSIAGPVLAGVLIPVIGYSWLYLIDTISLFATLGAVWRLPALPVERPQGSPGLGSVIAGLSYLSRHRILMMSFVVDLIAMILGMPRALFPQVAHESFGGPITGGSELALLSAGIPAGAVLGGVLSGWVSRVAGQGKAVIISILVWGAGIAGLGAAVAAAPLSPMPMLAISVFMLAVAGAADMASAAFRNAILLSAADDAVRGRLQGVFIVVVAGGPRIADVLHGYLGSVIGTAWTIGLGGVAVIVATIVVSAAVPSFARYRVRVG